MNTEAVPELGEAIYYGFEAMTTPSDDELVDASARASEFRQGHTESLRRAGLIEPEPHVDLLRRGPTYEVATLPVGAIFTFRDVRTSGELSADVEVNYRTRHLFRTTVTLSLAGRDKVAKVAAEFAPEATPAAWRKATFAAVERVLDAEEQLGAPVDLRTAQTALPDGGVDVLGRFWPVGTQETVAPGEAGKSTILRAAAVSLASGREVLPGMVPASSCPVLYVAAEDPIATWHARSVEAICRGLGMSRSALVHPIELFDARGRPLHRIARAIAERAADFGAVILDSHQALLAQVDASAGIRDRDSLFWHGIDQLDRPVAIVGHPNRADARDWQKADGRIAGSEVNRDRVRMLWRGTYRDEPAVVGTSYRRYTLENTKNNHGPRQAPIAFAAAWEYGVGGDPGVLRFSESEPFGPTPADGLSPALAETLRHYQAGATTTAALLELIPNLTDAAARQRLSRVRQYLGEEV